MPDDLQQKARLKAIVVDEIARCYKKQAAGEASQAEAFRYRDSDKAADDGEDAEEDEKRGEEVWR